MAGFDCDVSINGGMSLSDNQRRRFEVIRGIVTNVGLFILFVIYLCIGASIFAAIEGREPGDVKPVDVNRTNEMTREMFLNKMLELASDPMANKTDYQRALATYEDSGDVYEEYYAYWHQWSYGMSLFYCLKLLTTIGYGNITPVTTAGKLLSIVYAFFGIILLLTFLASIGSLLAQKVNSTYKRLRAKMTKRSNPGYRREDFDTSPEEGGTTVDIRFQEENADDNQQSAVTDPIPFWAITVFSLVFLLIFSSFVFALEDWTFVDSVYYSFMSLATVGFGDIIPEKNLGGCSILIVIGLIVVSMIIALGQASILRVLTAIQRCTDKVVLKCTS
ncbi:TWiK family of potassium channels protein 18-like isoform X2 [Anneissia japonica]|uniref:TWiK family of potassium channels protein 18-like isoform X1 n=1 Tax=Anneissia japonica TaxID=1529436 RepID=UPI0014258225|nr:TWiK family of potassium channels protein 18-like isoform X1 [Anneissia japonica]XP_033119602.1 TWiK family of potassium channels protein 18-like isoform X2 [Anneissia japonica]